MLMQKAELKEKQNSSQSLKNFHIIFDLHMYFPKVNVAWNCCN